MRSTGILAALQVPRKSLATLVADVAACLRFGATKWEAPENTHRGFLSHHASRGAGRLARRWMRCRQGCPQRQITFLYDLPPWELPSIGNRAPICQCLGIYAAALELGVISSSNFGGFFRRYEVVHVRESRNRYGIACASQGRWLQSA